MAEIEKKTLIEILESIQFIRDNIDCLEDHFLTRCDYIKDLLNDLSWGIQCNLVEKVSSIDDG